MGDLVNQCLWQTELLSDKNVLIEPIDLRKSEKIVLLKKYGPKTAAFRLELT